MAMCRTAGFARVTLEGVTDHSACISCYRKWLPVPKGASARPALVEAFHNGNDGINFVASRDEYVSIWFDCDVENLSVEDVNPQAGGYGVRPIHVGAAGQIAA